MTDRRAGFFLCIAAASGFSTTGILAKLAYAAHVNVVTLLAGRFLLASVLLWLIAAVSHQTLPCGRVLAAGFGLGLVCYGFQVSLLFLSLERIDATLSSLLFYSYPAMVTAGALLIGRERASVRRLSALCVALAGVVLVFSGAGSARRDTTGVLLSVASAFVYAVLILAADKVGRRTSPLVLSSLVSTGAATTFLLGGLLMRNLQLELRPQGWGPVIGLALIATVVPLAAFYGGVARIGPSTASIVLTVEPAMTVVLAAIVLGEHLGLLQFLGGGLVLSAVVLLQTGSSKSGVSATST